MSANTGGRRNLDGTQGPYSIGAPPDQWPGLADLIEETGKALQVAGQIIRAGTADSSADARILLVMRLGSLRAAIDYVVKANGIDPVAVNQYRDRMGSLYGQLHRLRREAAAQPDPDGSDPS